MKQRSENAFTVVELTIVVSVIAILTAIAVPALISARMTANERVVLASVRSISSAQARFRMQKSCDVNGDGVAEFGTIGELLGADAVRGAAEPLDPPLLSRQLSVLFTGTYHLASGYFFAVYLPDATGLGLNASTDAMSVDPVLASGCWTCLAWPAQTGVSGNTAFFVNQQGEILRSVGTDYSGSSVVPPPGAALRSGNPHSIVGGELATYGTGADGRRWVPVQG